MHRRHSWEERTSTAAIPVRFPSRARYPPLIRLPFAVRSPDLVVEDDFGDPQAWSAVQRPRACVLPTTSAESVRLLTASATGFLVVSATGSVRWWRRPDARCRQIWLKKMTPGFPRK